MTSATAVRWGDYVWIQSVARGVTPGPTTIPSGETGAAAVGSRRGDAAVTGHDPQPLRHDTVRAPRHPVHAPPPGQFPGCAYYLVPHARLRAAQREEQRGLQRRPVPPGFRPVAEEGHAAVPAPAERVRVEEGPHGRLLGLAVLDGQDDK